MSAVDIFVLILLGSLVAMIIICLVGFAYALWQMIRGT
jgi:hypothetical protein